MRTIRIGVERTWTRPALLAVGLVLLAAGPAGAQMHVWTATQTRRFLRSAPPGKQREAVIAAARNEWVSFQVLLRSDRALRGVSLQVDTLHGRKGARIGAESIRVFRQHQMELTDPTYRNDAFVAGWYPDGLIPARHPVTGKPLAGRLRAQGFDVPPGQTRGFWVDVHVPADAKAGEYLGRVTVRCRGSKAGERIEVHVPVVLTVWDFALPAVATLRTALGSPAQRMRSYYAQRAKAGKEKPPADWDAVDRQCAELLTRHRINAQPPSDLLQPVWKSDHAADLPPESLARLKAWCGRYHVNAICIPHPRVAVKDPVAQADRLKAWLSSWDRVARALGPRDIVFYTYLKDEPNDDQAYRYVQTWGAAVRKAKSVVKVLVVEQTWTQNPKWGDLYGAVDIWCPLFSLYRPASAAKRQALGESVWTYTALCQREPTPWWHIDFPLLHYRCWSWIAWRCGMRGILYWGGMSYWRQVDDPWTDPKTLDRRKGRKQPLFNGEGSIVYPGRACGYDGIAPSLRLKAIRDAIEDYEYMAILERLGRGTEARKVVGPLAKSWFDWEKDPAVYDHARAELARLIVETRGKP